TIAAPSTLTLPFRASTSTTFPRYGWRLAAESKRLYSLPAMKTTWSPRFILLLTVPVFITLYNLRSEADDLHEILLAKFAGHGPENACTDRRPVVFDKHGCIFGKSNVCSVLTANLFTGTHDHT